MEKTNVNANVKKEMTMRGFLSTVIDYGKALDFPEDCVKFAQERLEKMDKDNERRKSKGSKPKVLTEVERAQIEVITQFLSDGESAVVGVIKEHLAENGYSDISPQKTTALVKRMVADGQAEQIDVGRNKPYEYKLITEVTDTVESENIAVEQE